jgi:hypothetical protein
VPGDGVRAVDGGGVTRSTAVSGQDGSFTLTVPPGAFTMIEDVCGIRSGLDVQPGENGPVVLVLPTGC